jgi:WD40 repeat protein
VKTGAEAVRLKGHSDTVCALCLLPDGRLASASRDTTIRLWDTKTRHEVARFEGHSEPVISLCVLPDGRLASASWDNTIRLWDVKTGTESTRLDEESSSIVTLCLMPDGRLASACAMSGVIMLYDVKTGTVNDHFQSHDGVGALCVLPHGLIALAKRNTIRLWSLAASREITRLDIDSSVLSLAALPDHRLAAGDATGRVHWLEVIA